MIDLSGSELFAAAAKALLGAGVGKALADDGAHAALWLHAKGYNGTAAIVSASSGTTSAHALGVTTVDLLLCQGTTEVEVEHVDSAVLFVGLLGVASSTHGVCFDLACASDQAAVTITPTTISGPVEALIAPLHVTCRTEAGAAASDQARALRLTIADDDWRRVNEAAARTYVPSTEQSRATGAGAGLVDSD